MYAKCLRLNMETKLNSILHYMYLPYLIKIDLPETQFGPIFVHVVMAAPQIVFMMSLPICALKLNWTEKCKKNMLAMDGPVT